MAISIASAMLIPDIASSPRGTCLAFFIENVSLSRYCVEHYVKRINISALAEAQAHPYRRENVPRHALYVVSSGVPKQHDRGHPGHHGCRTGDYKSDESKRRR
ncbi:hypothetical protein ACFSLT_28525 [Novosphingobium resinovorum]